MKTLIIGLVMTLITSAVINVYAISVPPVIIEKTVYEKVAVNEVSIPLTYNADELDAYFDADYCSRRKCVAKEG